MEARFRSRSMTARPLSQRPANPARLSSSRCRRRPLCATGRASLGNSFRRHPLTTIPVSPAKNRPPAHEVSLAPGTRLFPAGVKLTTTLHQLFARRAQRHRSTPRKAWRTRAGCCALEFRAQRQCPSLTMDPPAARSATLPWPDRRRRCSPRACRETTTERKGMVDVDSMWYACQRNDHHLFGEGAAHGHRSPRQLRR